MQSIAWTEVIKNVFLTWVLLHPSKFPLPVFVYVVFMNCLKLCSVYSWCFCRHSCGLATVIGSRMFGQVTLQVNLSLTFVTCLTLNMSVRTSRRLTVAMVTRVAVTVQTLGKWRCQTTPRKQKNLVRVFVHVWREKMSFCLGLFSACVVNSCNGCSTVYKKNMYLVLLGIVPMNVPMNVFNSLSQITPLHTSSCTVFVQWHQPSQIWTHRWTFVTHLS